MSTPSRRAFVAQDPRAVAAKRIDQAWNNATQAAWAGLDQAQDLGGYVVNNPTDALDEVGDFAEDAARFAWDQIQDAYGTGMTLWNEIESVIQTPCEDKWNVLVETALPAAGTAILMLLEVQPEEVLEEYLQPYPTKKSRRGDDDDKARRKRAASGRRRRFWPRFPNPDAMVASSLPASEAIKGRQAGIAQRSMFAGIQAADRVGWYWLLADVTSNFVVNWTTGLMEARFCSEQWDSFVTFTRGFCSGAQADTTTCAPISADSQKQVAIGSSDIVALDANNDPYNASKGRATATIVVRVPLEEEDSRTLFFRCSARDKDGTLVRSARSQQTTLTPGASTTFDVDLDLDGAAEFAWTEQFVSGTGGVVVDHLAVNFFARS